jgi:hypothetical protein
MGRKSEGNSDLNRPALLRGTGGQGDGVIAGVAGDDDKPKSSTFAAMDAQLLYAAPSHRVCIIHSNGQEPRGPYRGGRVSRSCAWRAPPACTPPPRPPWRECARCTARPPCTTIVVVIHRHSPSSSSSSASSSSSSSTTTWSSPGRVDGTVDDEACRTELKHLSSHTKAAASDQATDQPNRRPAG